MTQPTHHSGNRWIAYAVHLYTAGGLVIAMLAIRAIFNDDYREAFFWMLASVVIDATDGTLARRYRIWEFTPFVDGRKLDDLVDFVNYTFVPVVMICHARWLPEPLWLWGAMPLVGSVFAFAHVGAKEDEAGFFRGFPSYWNAVAFYVWLYVERWGPWGVAALTSLLSVMSVMPVWFVYPNKAPRWRLLFIAGGVAWALTLVFILLDWRQPWMIGLSSAYPLFYVAASVYLARVAFGPAQADRIAGR